MNYSFEMDFDELRIGRVRHDGEFWAIAGCIFARAIVEFESNGHYSLSDVQICIERKMPDGRYVERYAPVPGYICDTVREAIYEFCDERIKAEVNKRLEDAGKGGDENDEHRLGARQLGLASIY